MATKTATYVGRSPAVEIEHPPGRWVTVRHGESIDLPATLADGLAPSQFEVKAKPAKKTAPEES